MPQGKKHSCMCSHSLHLHMCHHSDKGWAHTHSALHGEKIQVGRDKTQANALKLYCMKRDNVRLQNRDDNSPFTLNTNDHAVKPGIGETPPLLALQVYSPASDTCTTERMSVVRVMLPRSPNDLPSTVMILLSVRFCSTMPSFSQSISG